MGFKPRSTSESRWAVFLRAVNVGGRKPLPMARLREIAQGLGAADVATYIQSGNLVFSADAASARRIASELEHELGSEMGGAVPAVLRSAVELDGLLRANPFAGTDTPDNLVHVFLSREPPADGAGFDAERYAPDELRAVGPDVFVRYPNGAGRSKLTAGVVGRAFGAAFTARNVRTLARVAALAAVAPS